MLITNGTCVSTIMISRAGKRGNRRRHDSLTRGGLSLRCFAGEAFTVPAAVVMAADASLCGLRCDVLTVPESRVDRAATGYHRRELLGALVAHVLELRDAYVLNPG